MDKFDQHIIQCLKENARASNSEIARCVGLSRSAVTERIRKLESSGEIQGYQVVLKQPETLVSAYFLLTFERPCCEEITEQLRFLPEVKSVHSISGDIDMVVRVDAASMNRINEVRSHMETFHNLRRIMTCTVLKEYYSAADQV